MKFSLPDCKTAAEYGKRIRPMPIGLLRQMKEQREVVLETTAAELQEINKELARRQRRQPKKKNGPFVPYANDCGSCHGKPLDEVALCRDCNGTGEHQP